MKKQAVDQFGLEGDGLIENFFHLLWTKDPLFGTIPSVYVPHTVLIRYNEPIAWYFMKDGALKKKTKKNLTQEHIKQVFIRNQPPSGIVAVFMRYTFEESKDDPNVTFEYYSEKEFLNFINDKWTINNGILQQFIQPKGDKNYIIKANWSPKLCLFEKIESLTRINDTRFDIYDRALTFEAQKYHSREGPLRGYVLPNKVQRICANISQHVQNVSFESILIARMILHFKVDENSRIWLLLCTSLRVDQGPDVDREKMKHKVHGEEFEMNYKPEDYLSKIRTPENIKTNIIKGKPINMHKIYECINCSERLEPDSIFETTYKSIIEGYEWDHLREKDRHKANTIIKAKPDNMEELLERFHGNSSDSERDKLYDDKVTSLVPPLIKKIYPRLKDEAYKTLRDDLGFLKKTALFCEDCILDIQHSQERYLQSQKQTTSEFYGTGRLKPETVKFRFAHTMKAIQQKEQSQTMTNFLKYRQSPDLKAFGGGQSARPHSKHPSDLPVIFGDLKSLNLKAMPSSETLSVGSSKESEQEDFSNRVKPAVKILNPNLYFSQTRPKEIKQKSLGSMSPNPIKENHLLLSIITPRKTTLMDELTKQENALSSSGGLKSVKTFRTRQHSLANNSPQEFSRGLALTTDDLAKTLTNYMPKKTFLKTEYKSLKEQRIPVIREPDTIQEIVEGTQKPVERELFAPFRDKSLC